MTGETETNPPAALRHALEAEVALALGAVVDYVTRFIVLSDHQADAIALWAFHTHAFEAAEATPYLQITSAEKRSGKSRLLDVLYEVAAKAWKAVAATEAALFRVIEDRQPTVFLDEYDTIFNSKDYEGLRAILNAGFRPGTPVARVVANGQGFQVASFEVYSPKALAGIGNLPDTIADRSIRIELKRRAAGESVERAVRRRLTELARPLREQLESSARKSLPSLVSAEPNIPDELDDRAADIWEPLLAIADLAGPDWSQRARGAAIALTRRDSSEDESLGIALLQDIRRAFVHTTSDRMFTEQLLQTVAADEESPWVEWWNPRDPGPTPGAARQLARLLRPYGIHSQNIRLGETQRKGYDRAQFVDAWRRYLAPESGKTVPSVPESSRRTDGTENGGPAENLNSGGSAISAVGQTGLPDGLDWPERQSESAEHAMRADAEFLVQEGLAQWRDEESDTQ